MTCTQGERVQRGWQIQRERVEDDTQGGERMGVPVERMGARVEREWVQGRENGCRGGETTWRESACM